MPIIGICLGAELIAFGFGSVLRKEKKIISLRKIEFIGNTAFPKNAMVIERHSWIIKSLGKDLVGVARSIDGYEIIKHSTKPIFGLQFHPEIDPDNQDGDEIVNTIMKSLMSVHKQ